MRSNRHLLVLLCLFLGLSCCGGGGGGGGDGGGGGSGSTTSTNVLPITVNGSECDPTTSANYPDKPCVSVTVCDPVTGNCQTVNDILLDTGSPASEYSTRPSPLSAPSSPRCQPPGVGNSTNA